MNELGYSPKNLAFENEARQRLISGITKLANAVKSTLGPQGQTVLIESQSHTHGITVTKDGVTVARSIDLLDPVENLAIKIVKQAAAKTALDAGDGTTTSIVLAEAIIKSIIQYLDEYKWINKTVLLNEIQKEAKAYAEYLNKKSQKLTPSKTKYVATISANNDKDIGEIIAAAYEQVGDDGVVTVEKSEGEMTYASVTDGFKLDRGYSSALFVNNRESDQCIYENCRVLVCDHTIDNIFQIENVLKPIVKNQDKLLIIAECSTNMLNTLAANVVKNGVRVCVVQPPNFGWKQHELMEDIAYTLGGTYFSEKTGDDLSLITIDDLGHAKKVVVGKDETIITKDLNHSNPVDERVLELKYAFTETKKKADRDHILNRIAYLNGGIGVIKVGALTDTEQKERYDRVEDAVCAVRAAKESGILPGGGAALLSYGKYCKTPDDPKTEQDCAKRILWQSLEAPFMTILRNAGCTTEEVVDYLAETQDINNGWIKKGVDAKTKKFTDLMKGGIIDPAKVTTSALLNAVSVATTVMSTNAIVTLARTYTDE